MNNIGDQIGEMMNADKNFPDWDQSKNFIIDWKMPEDYHRVMIFEKLEYCLQQAEPDFNSRLSTGS